MHPQFLQLFSHLFTEADLREQERSLALGTLRHQLENERAQVALLEKKVQLEERKRQLLAKLAGS